MAKVWKEVIFHSPDKPPQGWQKRPIGILVNEPAPARKLTGKEWIAAELKRNPELRTLAITEAGRRLSKKSATARDCGKPLSAGRCINLLRDCFGWPKKPRNSPRQRPK